MKGPDCEGVPDKFFVESLAFRQEYGDYFVAKNSGYLQFEINDVSIADNDGSISIEVYVLTSD